MPQKNLQQTTLQQTTLHLVDASPYIFRAYFSIPSSFTNPAGEPVNAVFGFAHFLRRLQEVEEVTHLALTFDRSLTTSFRNEIYTEYEDLEAIYEHLEDIPSLAIRGARSLAGKLREQREMAFLSKRLATLAFDAPVVAALEDLRFRGPQEELLDPLVGELGFDPLRRARS